MIKLVRHKIPGLMRARGEEARVTSVGDRGWARSFLVMKLQEEVREYRESGDPAELVDIHEVVMTLWREAGRTNDAFFVAAAAKREEAGTFDQLVVMDLEKK